LAAEPTTVKGTFGFLPPELLTAEAKTADPFAADLWCVGETTYQLLTGMPVFDGFLGLWKYAQDSSLFPVEKLTALGPSDAALQFILSAMAVVPAERLTAPNALTHAWLEVQDAEESPQVPVINVAWPASSKPEEAFEPTAAWTTATIAASPDMPRLLPASSSPLAGASTRDVIRRVSIVDGVGKKISGIDIDLATPITDPAQLVADYDTASSSPISGNRGHEPSLHDNVTRLVASTESTPVLLPGRNGMTNTKAPPRLPSAQNEPLVKGTLSNGTAAIVRLPPLPSKNADAQSQNSAAQAQPTVTSSELMRPLPAEADPFVTSSAPSNGHADKGSSPFNNETPTLRVRSDRHLGAQFRLEIKGDSTNLPEHHSEAAINNKAEGIIRRADETSSLSEMHSPSLATAGAQHNDLCHLEDEETMSGVATAKVTTADEIDVPQEQSDILLENPYEKEWTVILSQAVTIWPSYNETNDLPSLEDVTQALNDPNSDLHSEAANNFLRFLQDGRLKQAAPYLIQYGKVPSLAFATELLLRLESSRSIEHSPESSGRQDHNKNVQGRDPQVDMSKPMKGTSSVLQHLVPRSPKREETQEIMFVRWDDPNSERLRPQFEPITRVVSKIGGGLWLERYRQSQSTAITSPIVGFKSKVVSRKHGKIFYENGQWHLQDMGSSSGTFLNNRRLAAPGKESSPHPLRDGDLIQLGIDYSQQIHEVSHGAVQMLVRFRSE
jgi:serine/threonine protein kinase